MIECYGKLARTSQPSAHIYTNMTKDFKILQTYSSYLPAASSLFPCFTALPAITSNFLAVSSAHRWMPNVQHNVRDWANRLIKGFAFKTSGTATLIYSCLPNLWCLDSGLHLIWSESAAHLLGSSMTSNLEQSSGAHWCLPFRCPLTLVHGDVTYGSRLKNHDGPRSKMSI